MIDNLNGFQIIKSIFLKFKTLILSIPIFDIVPMSPPKDNIILIQLSGFSEHEMNNPLALCELTARAPNISAGHKVKQAWLPNDRVFILDIHCHALM